YRCHYLLYGDDGFLTKEGGNHTTQVYTVNAEGDMFPQQDQLAPYWATVARILLTIMAITILSALLEILRMLMGYVKSLKQHRDHVNPDTQSRYWLHDKELDYFDAVQAHYTDGSIETDMQTRMADIREVLYLLEFSDMMAAAEC
ncbi:hypothetical protein Ciccas_011323, partial [Cichlidogyrus casuarinus]